MLDAILSYRRYLSAGALIGTLAALTACSSDKPFQPDLFSTSASPYAHAFNASHGDACEAARRAMLSQGYTTTISTADTVDANKGFQPTAEQHVSVSFHIVCIPGEASTSTSMLYVNVIQDNYGLKKSDTSASVGLSILGSVSLPIRSNSDSMVKISSQTIPPGLVYDRFFALVDHYLKTVVRSTPLSSDDESTEAALPPMPALIVPVATAAPAPVTIEAVPVTQNQVQVLKPPPAVAETAEPPEEASGVSTADTAVNKAIDKASDNTALTSSGANAAAAATANASSPGATHATPATSSATAATAASTTAAVAAAPAAKANVHTASSAPATASASASVPTSTAAPTPATPTATASAAPASTATVAAVHAPHATSDSIASAAIVQTPSVTAAASAATATTASSTQVSAP